VFGGKNTTWTFSSSMLMDGGWPGPLSNISKTFNGNPSFSKFSLTSGMKHWRNHSVNTSAVTHALRLCCQKTGRNCLFLSVNEQRNILHEIRERKANWSGHILRRNCLLKQVIEGKIKGEMEVARRRGRRRKKLLDNLKDRRGYSHLKEEALDRTMWRHRFGGGFGSVVRQNTE